MIQANLLIILSDIDGLYDKNPNIHANASHIPLVEEINNDIMQMATGSDSSIGTGGMKTKLIAAKIALTGGCHAVISQANQKNPILSIDDHQAKATWFMANDTPTSSYKNWLSSILQSNGQLIIDDGAVAALKDGKSLLPVGILRIDGEFNRGDAVDILDINNNKLARGLINFSYEEAQKIIGKQTKLIEDILGYQGRSEMIHRNEMVIL